jgi:hypothetical protein
MFRLRMVAVIGGIVLASVFSSPAFADAVLSIAPASSTVSGGTTFPIDVNISGVTDLFLYQFDLSFNPTVLEATNVQEGAFLSGGGSTFFFPGFTDNTGGSISFIADTLGAGAISGVTGGGTLVEIDFTAIAPGPSGITIPNNADLILQDSTGATISTSQTGGLVTVQGATAVPEPPGLLLFLTALLATVAAITLKKSTQ